MAKKPDRPRKKLVDDKKDMLLLVDLISSSKEEETKAKVDRVKGDLNHRPKQPSKALPSPKDLKLKEAKALAAARLQEKKRRKKEAKRKEIRPSANTSNAQRAAGAPADTEKPRKKRVAFG